MKTLILPACLAAAIGIAAQAETETARPRAPGLKPPVANASAAADLDARRAAASRLLVASHFRERQAVTIADGLRTAEADMADDCLDRAASGGDMTVCRAVAAPNPAMKARLAAAQSDILDEVIAASQTVYAQRFTVAEMETITRFFETPVGQRYANAYPQILTDVQARKRTILKRYLTIAATAGNKPS